jgi:hypothetical protein
VVYVASDEMKEHQNGSSKTRLSHASSSSPTREQLVQSSTSPSTDVSHSPVNSTDYFEDPEDAPPSYDEALALSAAEVADMSRLPPTQRALHSDSTPDC